MGRKGPGYRFNPTDVELVMYYLKRKVLGKKLRGSEIVEVDIYKYEPWDLPEKSSLRTGDLKWHFFCPREKKYACENRLNRATECGYWKTTGKDRPVFYQNKESGKIRTLVFHLGKAPAGKRTDWVLHEYRLEDKNLAERNIVQDTYLLCEVFKKDGLGPRNGAQYGAPFREEDWSDTEDTDCDQAPIPLTESCVLDTMHSVPKAFLPVEDTSNFGMPIESPPVASDGVLTLSDGFTEDGVAFSENGQDEEPSSLNHAENVEAIPQLDGNRVYTGFVDLGLGGFNHAESVEVPRILDENDYYNGLVDLADLGKLKEGDYDFSDFYAVANQANNMQFMELLDMDTPLNFPL